MRDSSYRTYAEGISSNKPFVDKKSKNELVLELYRESVNILKVYACIHGFVERHELIAVCRECLK